MLAQPEGASSLALQAALKAVGRDQGATRENQSIINTNLYLNAHPGGAAKVTSPCGAHNCFLLSSVFEVDEGKLEKGIEVGAVL